MLRIGNAEHYHFARLIHRNEQTLAVTRNTHQLRPAALCDGSEVEDRLRGAVSGVQQIQVVVEHSRREATLDGVTGNQLDVDGAAGVWDNDGAQDFPAFEVPDPHAAAQVGIARSGVEGRGRADEVTGHHQV